MTNTNAHRSANVATNYFCHKENWYSAEVLTFMVTSNKIDG